MFDKYESGFRLRALNRILQGQLSSDALSRLNFEIVGSLKIETFFSTYAFTFTKYLIFVRINALLNRAPKRGILEL